jgi:hypothetical protein
MIKFFRRIRVSGITEFGMYEEIIKLLIYYHDYSLPNINQVTSD